MADEELPPPPAPDDPAAITEADLIRARLAWRKVAPAGFKDILDAREKR